MNAKKHISILGLTTTALILMSCSKTINSSTDIASVADSSTSGAVASVAGGALSSSSAGGTIALQKPKSSNLNFIPEAYASDRVQCPKFSTTSSGCVASGSTMWLTLSSCSRANTGATWAGVEALTKSSGNATCGNFPTPPVNGTLIRQFVTAASGTTPGTASRTDEKGVQVTIDDATANLGNFDNDVISTVANSGYGTIVSFNGSGARTGMVIKKRLIATGKYDHSVNGTLTITEATSGSSSRTITGSIVTYHNIAKIKATSTFNSVTHVDSCCTPVSGSITTAFSAGTATPTAQGLAMVGKTETMLFTGCQTATLTAFDGTVSSVNLTHCF